MPATVLKLCTSGWAARTDPYREGNDKAISADGNSPNEVIYHSCGEVSCSFIMRMDLTARAIPSKGSDLRYGDVFLTLRPACRTPGEYSYTTDSDSFWRMLRRTDLPSTVLDKFEIGLNSAKGADLLAVELSEKTLTEIGYFVD
jgi:hypothetical protein